MLRILDSGTTLCDGMNRREWLRIGGIGMGGLTLGSLLAQQASAGPQRTVGKAKSVIFFGLTGGAPQHETWDPKPQAPQNIRGEFGTIASRTPGFRVGELMPRTSKWTDKIAVLRAVSTGDNAHSSSGYQMMTGVPHQPLNRESALAKAPNLWPNVGGLVRALRDRPSQLPSAIAVPEHIWNDGNYPWPGQDAGFLGRGNDPWLIHCNPEKGEFRVPGMQNSPDMTSIRVSGRHNLLQQMNRKLDDLKQSKAVGLYDTHAQKAMELISGTAGRSAFDLNKESDKTRDRYGRYRYGQSVLLARRLVEAGVSLVQINWTRIKGYENQGGWDTHAKHNESLKKLLMPRMDMAFTALLEDLEERNMLDETLVVWAGEFGHTPKFNKRAGRDHWGHAFSVALAGGGIKGGVVHGSTDKHAAYAVDGLVRPKDLLATVFHCLGYPPETEVPDPLGRPIQISRGQPIQEIL